MGVSRPWRAGIHAGRRQSKAARAPTGARSMTSCRCRLNEWRPASGVSLRSRQDYRGSLLLVCQASNSTSCSHRLRDIPAVTSLTFITHQQDQPVMAPPTQAKEVAVPGAACTRQLTGSGGHETEAWRANEKRVRPTRGPARGPAATKLLRETCLPCTVVSVLATFENWCASTITVPVSCWQSLSAGSRVSGRATSRARQLC